MPPCDQEARARAARLSTVSFETFYRRYFPILVRFLITQANNTNWAEDIAQDTMIAATDKWQQILTYERPDSWLFKVAIRKLRRLESRARELSCLPEDIESVVADVRIAAAADDWVHDNIEVVCVLRSLPRRQAEVLALRYLADYTLAEAAYIMGIKESAAKTHLERALKNLRRQRPAGMFPAEQEGAF
jgi:RNA polymerase sigma-70 factor (ECF subfamily)